MALTTLAVENSTIGPSQFADLMQSTAPRVLVDGPDDLRPSYTQGGVSITPGAGLFAGTRVRATGTNSITLPLAASGTITYVVVLRIDWTKSNTTAATLHYFEWPAGGASALINTTNTRDLSKINRIPGVMYDAVLASVVVGTTSSQQNAFTDYRMWGGDGGPIRVTTNVITQSQEFLRLLDCRKGAFISTDRNLYTKRLDDDGVWRDVGTASNPWRTWTPTLRFYKGDPINGVSGGTPVSLGTGGVMKGYYRVVDGLLDGFVSITTTLNSSFGTGPITMDLPLPCADWMVDTWSDGHIYTYQNNEPLDWYSQMLVKAGWSRGQLFAPVSGDFNDMKPHRNADTTGAAGTGIPKLVGAWTTGSVYTYHVSYPVQSLAL